MTTDNKTLAVEAIPVRDLMRLLWVGGGTANQFIEASAAIGELIAADEEYDAAQAAHDDSASYDNEGASVPKAIYERMEAARARRTAALARVKGESA
ncbi:hypothetical protein [Stenotrophomonas maltophilia]|uniref:hypothetical protein n=1 Tax=Stenotrophomonas maltophilia TaxID=40324 RepID=UPI002E79F8D5|nr:hypothetical protein [Stenotrophomonas maltophilia]